MTRLALILAALALGAGPVGAQAPPSPFCGRCRHRGELVARRLQAMTVRIDASPKSTTGRNDATFATLRDALRQAEKDKACAIGAVDGYDTGRLRDHVDYVDVGVPLQSTGYELPEALP